jgi:hypothetical protein
MTQPAATAGMRSSSATAGMRSSSVNSQSLTREPIPHITGDFTVLTAEEPLPRHHAHSHAPTPAWGGGRHEEASGQCEEASGQCGRRWTVVAEADAPALVVPIAAEAAPIGNEKVSRQPNLAAGLDP